MLITGGQSPFYGGSRFRTIARILTCQYHLGFCGLKHISHDAKHFIRDLLQQHPDKRMSAEACLRHSCRILQVGLFTTAEMETVVDGVGGSPLAQGNRSHFGSSIFEGGLPHG